METPRSIKDPRPLGTIGPARMAPGMAPTATKDHLAVEFSLVDGAPLRNRTVDLLLTMETLCRLS